MLAVGVSSLYAQQQTLTVQFQNRTLLQVVNYLGSNTSYEFVYAQGTLDSQTKITAGFTNATLRQILDAVLLPNGLEYETVDRVVSIRRSNSSARQPQGPIRGVVTTQSGAPLPGVTVIIEQSLVGVMTDSEGRFELATPQGQGAATLLFSHLGYESVSLPYTGQQNIEVAMRESIAQIDDVIVTGYSSRRASEMTGSVQKVGGEQIMKASADGGIFSGLAGATTGLQITGSSPVPGHDSDLLLRGMGTLFGVSNSSSETIVAMPLIVIDGNITDYTSLSGVIAPSDIADITILKDASSTAIYGSRAATGVIVVTTKQGGRGGLQINFNAELGISTPNFGKTSMMNSRELYEYGQMTVGNWWDYNESTREQNPDRQAFIDGKFQTLHDSYNVDNNYDWRKHAYDNAISQQYSVSLSGGSEKSQYYVSYNHRSEEGILKGYDLDRNMFRGRFNFDIFKFLSINANVSASFSNAKSPNGNSGETMLPWIQPRDENGVLIKELPNWGGSQYELLYYPLMNPQFDAQYNSMISKTSDLFGSFGAVVKPFEWLSFSTNNTFTLNDRNDNDYYDNRSMSGNSIYNGNSNGRINIADFRENSFLTSNILRANHTWGDHSLSGLIGQEWYTRHSKGSNVRMYDQTVMGERNLGAFSQLGNRLDPEELGAGGDEYEKASFSMFSEVFYNFRSKYMFSASVRADQSTNFGKNNRTGIFYSLGGAWLVTGENFMKNQRVFDALKLRFSYGTSGKEAGIDYLNYTLYRATPGSFNYYGNHPNSPSQYPAFIDQLGNPDLSWEVAYNTNVGLDFSFLSNRISSSFDLYHRRNSKLIMPVNMPSAQGVGTQYRNVGEMVNKGIELTLNTHNIKTENFNWYTSLVFNYNHNELTKIYDGEFRQGQYRVLKEGDNIDNLKTLIVDHIDPQTGHAIYQTITETEVDGQIVRVTDLTDNSAGLTSDMLNFQKVGVTRAPYWGGFNNTFRYKNLELNVRTSFAFGYYARNSYFTSYQEQEWWRDYGYNMMKLPSGVKMWEKPGDVADIPIRTADPNVPSRQSLEYTNLEYSKADHFKIAQIRLTYYIPTQWLQKIRLSNAYVSFTCDNVHTFARKEFQGLDPDAIMGYGSPRRFVFSLNVSF